MFGPQPAPAGEDWGAGVEATVALAPYLVEVEQGQVAVPGQRDGVVEWLQGALVHLGYPLALTQTFDPATEAALQTFQRLNRLEATCCFGPEDLAALEHALDASVSLAEFQDNAPQIPEATLREYLPHLNAAMARADLTSDARKAAFLAQLGHESDGFNTLEEYASGAQYEGRRDLGNVHPGDGRRFKGRGPIQITGRTNYASYGAALGVDLIENPELAATPEVGFQVAAEFWDRQGLNRFADRGRFDTITRRINGGQNGRADRRSRWRRAQRVLREGPAAPALATSPRAPVEADGALPVLPSGVLDAALLKMANGDLEAAMAEAERVATREVDDEVLFEASSRTRDLARLLLDAREAFSEERYRAAKEAAHHAAEAGRALRDTLGASSHLTDPVVAAAGQAWQRAHEAESVHGRTLDLAALEAALPLRQGARGDAVAALQRLLGMDVAGGDGIFGPATHRAVVAFQRQQGLGADGIVGPGTLGALRG